VELGVAVVADGMGGHSAGEVASRMAVDIIMKEMAAQLPAFREQTAGEPDPFGSEAFGNELSEMIDKILFSANRSILDKARSEKNLNGMATTMVLVFEVKDVVALAHVGDSRIYKMRAGQLEQITEDHSLAAEYQKANVLNEEEARSATYRSLVTRAMGVHGGMLPDIKMTKLEDGDMFLLCSDGLSDMLTFFEIESILAENKDDLERATTLLVERANELGGVDNITVVAAKYTNA